MAESTLSISRVDLLRAVGRYLSVGRDSTTWDANTRSDINDVVDIGCRKFYHPPVLPGETNSHDWSFLRPVLQNFSVNAGYSTGTITISSGVVTLSGGTWPSWAADGLVLVNGYGMSVNTRDSNTQLTLDSLVENYSAGTKYALTNVDPTLPDLFGGFIGDLTFTHNARTYGRHLIRTTMDEILTLRQQPLVSSFPQLYAVHPKPQTGETPQRWTMSIWPNVDRSYTITGKMSINPYQLTADKPYHMGGMPFGECLRESCLAAAETEIEGEVGIHSAAFMRELQSAVSYDRRVSNPGVLGNQNVSSHAYAPWNYRDYIRRNSAKSVGYLP